MRSFRPEWYLTMDVGKLHRQFVFTRRVDVLSKRIGALLPPNARLLDVGCGDGSDAALIMQHRPDVKVEGIDVLLRPGTKIPVTEYDGERFPFENHAFDATMFVDVLHHTDAPSILLREAARVSKKWILIKDHLRDGFLAGPTLRIMDYVGNAHHGVRLPYNYWDRKTWDAAFKSSGMRIADWDQRLGLYPFPASILFDRDLHFIARLAVEPSPAF